MTAPIAMMMGLWMFKSTPGKVRILGPSIVGVLLLLTAVLTGHTVAKLPPCALSQLLRASDHRHAHDLWAYCFLLPVWLLLEPRDYLATYVKLGTIVFLCIGIFVVHPQLQFPMVSKYAHGGGPIIHGQLFPFLFITIACGAISGFHSLIASGTTPKMLDKESDARFIGYGAMAAEALVAVMALICGVFALSGRLFAINVPPAVFANLGLHTVDLARLSSEVGENLAGRTGGGVSLAIGMAHIFRDLPHMDKLVSYWYHYAVMFEALFILTTVDAGTRSARYILQEILGKAISPSQIPNGFPEYLSPPQWWLGRGIFDLYRLNCDDLAVVWSGESVYWLQ